MADSVYRDYAKSEAGRAARQGLMQAGAAAAAISGAVGSVSPSWGAAAYAVGGAATLAWTAARAGWAAHRSPRQSLTDIQQTSARGQDLQQASPEALRNVGRALRTAGRDAGRHASTEERVRGAEQRSGTARHNLTAVRGGPSRSEKDRSAPTRDR